MRRRDNSVAFLRHELGSTRTHCGLQTICVTVSGGVAAVGEAGLDEALKQADRALYQAKHEGRDRMMLAAGQGAGVHPIARRLNAA